VNASDKAIPRAPIRICDLCAAGRWDEARRIERLIGKLDAIIAEGHPIYGRQCCSRAPAAAVGVPVGDVRRSLTTFRELGREGQGRAKRILAVMAELDTTMDRIDGKAALLPVALAAE